MRFLIIALILHSCTQNAVAQGHINHIKNQSYLKVKAKVDCNNSDGDNLSSRICANLAFQQSDSLLVIVYNDLLSQANKEKNNELATKVIEMQTSWRKFRDQHCGIIYDRYEGCGGCHLRAINYLQCLKELTDTRTAELKKLSDQLFENE